MGVGNLFPASVMSLIPTTAENATKPHFTQARANRDQTMPGFSDACVQDTQFINVIF